MDHIMKLNKFYVEGRKFYWFNLPKKVQIFVGSMTDQRHATVSLARAGIRTRRVQS